MKKNFLVLGTLALALAFTFVACDSSQPVEVTNWGDISKAPAFSGKPVKVQNTGGTGSTTTYKEITFKLTGASGAVARGGTISGIAYKIDGKNGFYTGSTSATATYTITDDIYDCTITLSSGSNPTVGSIEALATGTSLIRIGIPYSTFGSTDYVWSEAF